MKNIITLGVGALAIVGGLFLYNKSKKSMQIPRLQVVSLLKQFRQQMYIPLLEISNWACQNASHASPDQLRNILQSQQNPFKDLFQEKQDKVFAQISKQDFEQNIQFYYKNDVEIQYLLKQYQQQFQKAVLGVSPQIKQSNIVFMTQQKLLATVEDLLSNQLNRLHEKIKIKMSIEQIGKILKEEQKQSKSYRYLKLKQLGLTMNEQIINDIFEFSICKYLRMDMEFKQRYESLVKEYSDEKDEILQKFCLQ